MWYIKKIEPNPSTGGNTLYITIDSACCRDRTYIYEESKSGEITLDGIVVDRCVKDIITYARQQGFVASEVIKPKTDI